MKNLRVCTLLEAAVSLLFACALPAASEVVLEVGMASHCAESAATELGVIMHDVLTLPAERTSGIYHVYGQYPASGQDVTLFHCQYDADRTYLGISIEGHQEHHGEAVGGVPRVAQRACTDMIGAPVTIEQVSPLRPGYHEIIMRETNGARRVACTVADDGTLQDWVEMN